MNSTRERVLARLEKDRGSSLSGEELAAALGVSRAAIWKAIAGLREEGHAIEAAPNRGYLLRADSDVLCPEAALPYLTSRVELHMPREVSSTNTLLRELALKGAPEGTL